MAEKTYIIQIIKTDCVKEEETIFEFEEEYDDTKMSDQEIAINLLRIALDGCTNEDQK